MWSGILLLCFIVERNSLEVVFNRGKNYSQCPDDATATIFSIDCAPVQDWDDEGNASSHLLVIEPAPADGCLVRSYVFGYVYKL